MIYLYIIIIYIYINDFIYFMNNCEKNNFIHLQIKHNRCKWNNRKMSSLQQGSRFLPFSNNNIQRKQLSMQGIRKIWNLFLELLLKIY